ncbi:MAG: hypothetical protein O7J95_03320, partial [Planctomycetota bacterium]|nr:hypothetical protein [Planctomycetota bacterium]
MKRQPSYRRQKEMRRPDRAFVDIDGRRIHLGEYGTAESWKEYHRVIAEWAANGRRLPVDLEELT